MWKLRPGHLCFFLFALLCLGVSLFALAQQTATYVRSVVRIEAIDCPGGSRQGTGFVWSTRHRLVTALHVVSGCGSVHATYPAGGGRKEARIIRVLRADDLALLSVESPPEVEPLQSTTAMPAAGAMLMAWGYPLRVRGIWDTEFIRRQSNAKLEDVLVKSLRDELRPLGMPALNSQVVWLDRGHLYPGQSGGPLFDSSGRVAAIANGGLEQGASSINWAIPALRLTALLSSSESEPDVGPSKLLFAGELVDGASFPDFVDPFTPQQSASMHERLLVDSVRCGAGTLAKTRTRSLSELSRFTDDPVGLQQLLAAAGSLIQESDQFDLYQHVETGATAVLPAGSMIQPGNDLCTGTLNNGTIKLYVQVSPSTPADMQRVSERFERIVGQRLGPEPWQMDPAWTMLMPLSRPDGLIARRKAATQHFNFQPKKYSFESLSYRGGMFLGVAYVRMNFSPIVIQQQRMCLLDGTPPSCEATLDDLKAAVRASIGVHLSTFPLG